MSKLKQLAGETVLYGLSTLLPRMLNFLLVPLHTYAFSREQYGVVTKLFAVVGFLNVVYMFGMETAFFRFATRPGADGKRIFNLAQTVVTGISVSLTVLLISFSSPLARSFGISGHPEFITWLALVMLVDAMAAIPFAQLRLEKKALLFAGIKILNVVLLFGLTYYFLKINYDASFGVGYVFLATLLANLLYIFFFAKKLLSWSPAVDRQVSPEMLRYAYPVMLTGVAGMTNEMFSRLTLDWWLPRNFYPQFSNEAAMGIFGACYKFAVFMNLGIQAFRFAAEPFFFSNAADKKSPELFARVNHYFVIVCCIFLVGVSVNLDVLRYFIASDYRPGLHIVPILLLAYLFLGVYYNISIWFKVTDRTYFGTWITLGGAALTIVANYLLIPQMGFTGSAWAALLCYFLMAVSCYVLGQKYYPVPYQVLSGLLYIMASLLAVYLINLIEIRSPVSAFVAHNSLLILLIGLVYFFERKNLRTS